MNSITEAQNAMMHQMQSNHHAHTNGGSYHSNNNNYSSLSHEPPTGTVGIKRPGLPPTPPSSYTTPPLHSRSSSQPSFFSLDGVNPFVPSPSLSDSGSGDASMEDHDSNNHKTINPSGLPPRKAHRRSRSDVSFPYFQAGAPPLPPPANWGLGFDTGKMEGEAGDDLFNAYLNLEGLDALNSSDDKHDQELDSRGSSMNKTNGAESSENESENSANESGAGTGIRLWGNYGEKGVKRNAAGDPTNGSAINKSRHSRSLSMDSLMGKLNFADPLAGLPPQANQRPNLNGNLNGSTNKFSLEFGSAEFSPAEMKKIMADEKLAEMALADPKRVKRVLANRQSAARSKERKMRYIAELEQKVQILQTEATTLSTQLTMMQRDSAGLMNHNNELKFRLQAMEQQAQLRDALNEALTGEVQRLKLTSSEIGDSSCSSNNNLTQQVQNRIIELQQQEQPALIPFYQLQQNGTGKNDDSKK
ncbi:hypothetical protein LUZ60_014644 [Juncus effusus]|nr:hypothetical protein LUZ60_014644 [Juncus effusus]